MGRGKRGASSELVAKGVLVHVLGRSRRVSSDVETMWVTTTFRSLPPIVPSRREWRDVRVKPRTLRSAHTTGRTRAAEYDMVAKARASVGRVACKKEWCGSDAAQRTKSLLAPKYQVVIRFPRRFPRSVKASYRLPFLCTSLQSRGVRRTERTGPLFAHGSGKRFTLFLGGPSSPRHRKRRERVTATPRCVGVLPRKEREKNLFIILHSMHNNLNKPSPT